MQRPLQRVIDRNALADQPLAVINEQPQVEFGTFQLRRRQGIQTFAQRDSRARRRESAISFVVTRMTRSPR
jgi:hypothetical protein